MAETPRTTGVTLRGAWRQLKDTPIGQRGNTLSIQEVKTAVDWNISNACELKYEFVMQVKRRNETDRSSLEDVNGPVHCVQNYEFLEFPSWHSG